MNVQGEGMRINKFLAEAGVCSRRGADELVLAGAVTVNGAVVTTPGVQVDVHADRVEVRGRPVRPVSVPPCCLMLNKPVRVVSTARDPEGRPTVLDLVPPELAMAGGQPRRLYPVGRLDYFSEGLLLLTDDGELTQRLVHPRHHVPKTYRVTVRDTLTPQGLRRMREGMTLAEGERLPPVQARILRDSPAGATTLELILHQGVNRQIRRMCRDLGLTVLRLVRVAQGPLELGDLAPGACRALTAGELRAIRRAVGLADDSGEADKTARTVRAAPADRISAAPGAGGRSFGAQRDATHACGPGTSGRARADRSSGHAAGRQPSGSSARRHGR